MLYNWYIRVEFLLCFLMGFFTIFSQPKIVSICFACTFILLFLTYFLHIFQYRRVSALLVLLITISILNILVNTGYADVKILFSIDYINKIIIFISTILSFYITLYIPSNKITQNCVIWLPIMLGSFLIISYYFWENTATYANGITLGFHNPNFTAMWLSHLLLYGFYCLFKTKITVIKIACILYGILIIHLIILTRARACIGGIICFAILLIIGMIKRSYKSSSITIGTVLLFPILFATVYMGFSNYLIFTSDFDFIISEGKDIMSRFSIWKLAFSHFASNWWSGDYAGISEGTGLSQMHNTHLDILASYGVVPFLLFLIIMWNILKQINTKISSFPSYVAFISFLTIILTGTFEAGLVSGCMGLNFLTSGFLLLAKGEKV